jgi:hypothetical protein
MQPDQKPAADADAARALRFMAIKAAIFIGIPLIAAAIAAVVILARI